MPAQAPLPTMAVANSHPGPDVATNLLAQIERLWANLRGLGVRRLSALALIGVAVFATTGLAGYYLSRPTMETLYSGLDRDDISAIGAALREAGVPFDVNAESTVVLTPAGQAAAARMILAEKGLPRSGAVGNELYDKLGSLGLTSFMQDVTRLRALEGELARTIQMMRTVKAARVHIVLADEGSFRRERQPSSASVVIRTDGGDDRATGQAIRHLVASAVPGMKLEDVTVLNVDGALLAYGADSVEKSPDNLLGLEKEVSQQIRESVSRTLTHTSALKTFRSQSLQGSTPTKRKRMRRSIIPTTVSNDRCGSPRNSRARKTRPASNPPASRRIFRSRNQQAANRSSRTIKRKSARN